MRDAATLGPLLYVTKSTVEEDAIKVGDEVAEYNGSHFVIVVEKKADFIIIAEGNFNDEVRWGREVSRSDFENNNYRVNTVYPE